MWKNIAHGYDFVKGKACHPMEDYVVSEFKKVDGHDLGLFAIFDGHLGHDVAKYLQTNLFDNILKEVTPFFFLSISSSVPFYVLKCFCFFHSLRNIFGLIRKTL